MTKKRKSIVSSFGDFTAQSVEELKLSESPVKPEPSRQTGRVGAGIVGATKRSLTDIREERDRLLATVEDTDTLLSLDPNDIDPSPFKDRLPDDSDDDYELFKSTLKEEGQKVPITVRRNSENEHRYQIVFGHRRVRALKELGLTVRAQLVDYSDRDLVVAQGIENASRQDLSWIEKAMFSARMESACIKPKDIKAALSVDDAQLSKFRVVTRRLSAETIELIGRAPSIGRPRWLDLAERVSSKVDEALIVKTLSADKVLALSSDGRFLAAFGVLSNAGDRESTNSGGVKRSLGNIGEMTLGPRGVHLAIELQYRTQFSAFFDKEINGLIDRFMETIKENE